MITTAIAAGSDGTVVLSSGATYGILLAILFTHGIVCSGATRVTARLNVVYAIITVGATVAATIALLVASGNRKVSTRDAFLKYENHSGWQNDAWAFLLSFTSPMFALTGYDSAAHISEEVAGAARVAPIAILVGVGATAGLGWILIFATSFVIPSVSNILASDLPLPMGQVFLDVLGKRGMLAIWSMIIVVQYVTGAAQGIDASRTVFAFSRDHALPGSRWWRRINRTTLTPVNAAWLVMALSGVCGVVGFSATALNSLVGASVIGLYTSYTVPIFFVVFGGRKKIVPGPFNMGKLSRFIGGIAVLWVTFIIVVLVFPVGQAVTAENMNYAIVIIGAVFIFASISWVVSARHWFHGPVKTVGDNSVGSLEGSEIL
ncbi:hypothetical protein PQX77_017674 [Marasmius sp. AFHP31]|nr:hypothetical protein PQX77_017674 [Marasmius sp. AFHP31]